MRLVTKEANGATLQFTEDELHILNNALNEVCNGLDLWEFSTRMGAERGEVQRLLAEIQNLLDAQSG